MLHGWLDPSPIRKLRGGKGWKGVERGGPVAAYIDPGLLFHPERSILQGLKLLGGGLGGIYQFWIKT